MLFKKRIFNLFLLLIFSISLNSQTSSKIIVVDENGESLIGANIMVYQNDSCIGGTASDLNGAFNFEEENRFVGEKNVEISYLGYQSYESNLVNLMNQDTVQLIAENYQMDEIFVIAYRHTLGCHLTCTISMVTDCFGSDQNAETKKLMKTKVDIPERSWNYYPNPTSRFLTIENRLNQNGEIEIYDIRGVRVLVKKCFESKHTYDLVDLIGGTYIVRYIDNGKTEFVGMLVKI